MPQLALPALTPWTKRLLIANGVVFVGWFLLYLAAPAAYEVLLRELALKPDLWRSRFPFVRQYDRFTRPLMWTGLELLGGKLVPRYQDCTQLVPGHIGSTNNMR